MWQERRTETSVLEYCEKKTVSPREGENEKRYRRETERERKEREERRRPYKVFLGFSEYSIVIYIYIVVCIKYNTCAYYRSCSLQTCVRVRKQPTSILVFLSPFQLVLRAFTYLALCLFASLIPLDIVVVQSYTCLSYIKQTAQEQGGLIFFFECIFL